MKVVIVDYGMGNLRSVEKALEKVGVNSLISASAEDI
ncbi:MAG: imidazole glycerol phosphate synthase subunit HisH, partial [Candidatus Sumerlaeaceae bacterium]